MRAMVWRVTSSTGSPVIRARAVSISMSRSVAIRPGAMPLIRTGTISSTSDLMRPASPGRSRFEADSPGIGSRAELDRMTGVAALAQVRQRRPQESDRAPQGAVDGGLPGRLVELVEATRRRTAGVDDQQ